MKQFGSALQIAGLILLPAGMILELTNAFQRDGLADMLLLMVFGFCLFYAGRVVEGYSEGK